MSRCYDLVFRQLVAVVFLAVAGRAAAGEGLAGQVWRPVRELIEEQEGPRVESQLFERMTPEGARIVIALGRQRAFLIWKDEVVIDTPVSTGKRNGVTPTGDFAVVEKSREVRSELYGNFVDAAGRVAREGVSARIDAAPAGCRFESAPARWFLRLTQTGAGLHEGILPGYAAADGCVRLPGGVAEMFYAKVVAGTPVTIIP